MALWVACSAATVAAKLDSQAFSSNLLEASVNTAVILRALARFDEFQPEVAEVVHSALATRPEARVELSRSPVITDTAWLQLWGPKTPGQDVVHNLVSRQLTGALRDSVVDRERRSTVLSTFFAYNDVTADELRRLATKPTAAAARVILRHRNLDPDLRRLLALKAGGRELVEEIAFAPTDRFSDSEVVELLQQPDIWRTSNQLHRHTELVLLAVGRRPEVMRRLAAAQITDLKVEFMLHRAIAAAGLDSETAERLAGISDGRCAFSCSDLQWRFRILVPLLDNPRTPPHVAAALKVQCASERGPGHITRLAEHLSTRPRVTQFSSTADPAELEVAMSYTLASPWRPRALELIELLENPYLPNTDRDQLLGALPRLPRRLLDTYQHRLARVGVEITDKAWQPMYSRAADQPLDDELASSLRRVAEKLGANRSNWDTLLSLLPEFDGPFDELVAVTLSL